MIKPDAVERGLIGKIIMGVEEEGFNIVNMRMTRLSREEAEDFYSVHRGKEFFLKLINYIIRDKIVAIELRGKNIIERLRFFIGDTDPKKAKKGTIREKYGINGRENTVHASDSKKNAEREINFFFG